MPQKLYIFLVIGVLLFIVPALVRAQQDPLKSFEKLTENGVIFKFSTRSEINFKPSREATTNEVIGYTDAIDIDPKTHKVSIGVFLENFIVFANVEKETFTVNRYADVNQTASNSSDDIFVERAERRVTSLTIERTVHPDWFWRFFLRLGLGYSDGELTFQQDDPNDAANTRKRLSFNAPTGIVGIDFFLFGLDNAIFLATYEWTGPLIEHDFSAKTQGGGLIIAFIFEPKRRR